MSEHHTDESTPVSAPETAHCGTVLPVGSTHILQIDDLAFGGEGVGRVQGWVVFVSFVIPGEEVEVEIVEVKKSFARARLVRVITPSPERVTPGCQYFGACGGCQYQHIAYEAQVRFKQKQVTDLLQRIGGIDPARVAPLIPCPRPYNYRNRIMVRSQWNKVSQSLNIGFLRYDSRLVVDVEQCPISEPSINEQLQQVRAKPPPRGGLKVVLRLLPQDWEVPPDSFFQNNYALLPRLVDGVRERLADSGLRMLIDAYCGVGFFSLELAGIVDRFVGIELDKPAIRAAKANAQKRGVTHGEFILGSTEEWLPKVLEQMPAEKTALIIDPPRTGCHPGILEKLREVRPAQILYVSCHPATLARDLNVLCDGSVYHLERLTPLDMFPQTQHVECIADLRAGHGGIP